MTAVGRWAGSPPSPAQRAPAFDTDAATVYQIRRQHRNEEVRELIPSDYAGTMACDRGRSYDAKELRLVKQQKCLSHIQRSLSEVLESQKGEAREFGSQLKGLLSESIALWHAYHAGEAEHFIAERDRLKAAVTEHLADRQLVDRDNQRLLSELGRHHDAGNLLRFLDDPKLEPTNNRAERALRPAVIARKCRTARRMSAAPGPLKPSRAYSRRSRNMAATPS